MPRICDSANEPHDFCLRCFPTEGAAILKFGNIGDGPDNRGNCFEYDTEHPDYGGDRYRCEKCGLRLTTTRSES